MTACPAGVIHGAQVAVDVEQFRSRSIFVVGEVRTPGKYAMTPQMSLIEALAAEFRLLNRVSGQTLIPLAYELELCRAHLRVMSLRKGAACALEVTGAAPDAAVPPALFLTLVENGLTHLLPRDGRLDFALTIEPAAASRRYTLRVTGLAQEGAPAEAHEGTGIRYIKARLEESYTGRWTLSGGPTGSGWQTTIEIAGAPVMLLRAGDASTPTLPVPCVS